MATRDSLTRYALIINKLRRHPASLKKIDAYLAQQEELQGYKLIMSPKTFRRDLDDILSLYHIDIQYDFSEKVYRIVDDDKSGANGRLLEAFDTFNALNHHDGLSKYVHFEKRKPLGTENLYDLLHAIKNNQEIKFTYQKFWEDEQSIRSAAPYALKEFRSRWYVIAKDNKDGNVKTFALDRLTNLEITNRKFVFPANYNCEEYYRYCFGIMSPNDETPEEIILSFDPFQGKYVKTLPLHKSQQILIDKFDELQIKLTLYITYDFIMELLSFGDKVKVLKPESLANEIKAAHQKAFAKY